MNLSEVIIAINAAPRVGKRINWSADLATAANTACAIISADNAHMAVWNIYVDTGASRATLALLSRGCKPNGQVWPELRDSIQSRGMAWRTHAPMVPRESMVSTKVGTADATCGAYLKHDPASGDIIVTRTTTQTLKYGTDEHKAATILMAKHATPAA